MLEHDNLDEFADAENYDSATDDLEGKLGAAFYHQRALAHGGPVLDVACGTGRVAVPMAQAGLAVTGVDITTGMLNVARRKAGNLPIRWIEADARAFDLGERFRFVFMTGNAFQAFISRSEQEAVLSSVRNHLAADGIFAFEVRNPRWARATGNGDASGQRAARYRYRGGFFANLESDSVERPAGSFIDSAGNEVAMSESQEWDHANQVLHLASWRKWTANGQLHSQHSRTALRYIFPQELRMLLEYNGFAINAQYGDWDESPLIATSVNLITLCRRA